MESFQKEHKDKRSVDIVTKLIGVSQGELAKEKYVVQAVRKNPSKFGNLISKIDSGKISVESAYKEIKDETWKQKQIEDNKIAENSFGKLFSKDRIRILEGDFRNVALKELKVDSIGLIFTDPPYDKKSLYLYRDRMMYIASSTAATINAPTPNSTSTRSGADD